MIKNILINTIIFFELEQCVLGMFFLLKESLGIIFFWTKLKNKF